MHICEKVALKRANVRKKHFLLGEFMENSHLYTIRIICGHHWRWRDRGVRIAMNRKDFFHICANGAETRNFIICEADYYAAFNLIGVCAANSRAEVISFSIEDSHPHILVWGTTEECASFMLLFETIYRHHVAAVRSGGAGLMLNCELYPIGGDEDYLRNVAVYTVIQPTKDGKHVMFYDYRWGTGSMYFRNQYNTPVWYFNDKCEVVKPVPFKALDSLSKRRILNSRKFSIPEDWFVCNGFILPSNYIDTSRFENIYQTHNRYRVFMSSPKKREQEILARMAGYKGVTFEDLEARKVCGDVCREMFGTRDPRRLDGHQRIYLAQQLRRRYQLSFRQIAAIVRLPEVEIRTYV